MCSLVPRPLPDFIPQLWREHSADGLGSLLHHRLKIVYLVSTEVESIMHVRWLRKAADRGQVCHSVSKSVSTLGPLSSRMEKQMARLLVGMYKLSKPFLPWFWAKLGPHYVLTESTISGPWCSNGPRPSVEFFPQLQDKSGNGLGTRLGRCICVLWMS